MWTALAVPLDQALLVALSVGFASLIRAFLRKYRNDPAIPAEQPKIAAPSVTSVALYPSDKTSASRSMGLDHMFTIERINGLAIGFCQIVLGKAILRRTEGNKPLVQEKRMVKILCHRMQIMMYH